MSAIRWAVYRDLFPLAEPELLPLVVVAADKPTAERLARALAGYAVVVRSMLAREADATRAPLGPPRLLRRAARGNQAKERYRAFAAMKRHAHYNAKRAAGEPTPPQLGLEDAP